MPLRGVEPLSQTPEACALSIELQGLDKKVVSNYILLYFKIFYMERSRKWKEVGVKWLYFFMELP